jgi:hypothetical protein
VSGENESGTFRNFINLVNKNSSALFQTSNNVLVVNDFLANINRGSIVIQGFFNRDNGSVHTGAVTPGGGQKHAL